MFGNSFMPMAMQQAGFSALDMIRNRQADPYAGLNYKPAGPPNSMPPKLNGGPSMTDDPGIAQMARPDASPINAPLPVGGMDQLSNGMAIGRASAPVELKRKGGMFGSGSGQKIAEMLVAGINGYLAGMGNPVGMANLNAMNHRRAQQEEYAQRMRELQAKQLLPQNVGGSLVQLGPDGQYHTLYDAPQAFDKYAESLGYKPGTPEYQAAVQDYRLGSWSDPAMEAKRTLEGIRYGYRDQLQDDRLDVTRRGQDLNHQDRQASIAQSNTNNIRSTGVSRSNAQLRSETQRGAYGYSHGGGRGGKGGDSIPDGTIIKNPSTGQRMKRQGGQWVPIS